jgi:hypothetical protein
MSLNGQIANIIMKRADKLPNALHPYSIESLRAGFNEHPPPPPDGSTLQKKSQYMASKSKAKRINRKEKQQQEQQGRSSMAISQGHPPPQPRVPAQQSRRQTNFEAAQYMASPNAPLAPLQPLRTLALRPAVPRRVWGMPLPTPPDPYVSAKSEQLYLQNLYLQTLRSREVASPKKPEPFDSPHTLDVKVWQKDFTTKIQEAYEDPKIQKLGGDYTKDEMETAGILLSLGRPLPASAEEQNQEKSAWPPVWSKPVIGQAIIGIGFTGKAERIKMPTALAKAETE